MSNTASESDASENAENTFCIFLHLVEGIGLHRRDGIGNFTERHKDKVILNASLNGVKFEIEGHSTETVTIFNSNCIWECELGDIKRMKTDNRPVKLELFINTGRNKSSPRRGIGTLLLPLRGVPVVSALKNVNLKLHWHKLNVLSSEWRHNKPEIYLLLVIVRKKLIESGQFEAFLGKKKGQINGTLTPKTSETTLMLQSQSNVYVQLLEQVGLIQVGNNPDIDCDIYNVAFTFKQLKNLKKIFASEKNYNRQIITAFVFYYDFLGSASQLEMPVNQSDCYTINEKISINFKSSLMSLRTYFQRIFYIPISLSVNGVVVANYRIEFSKLLPEDTFFSTNKAFSKSGTFYIDRISKPLSPRAAKPALDYLFAVQLVTNNSKKPHHDFKPMTEAFTSYRIDEKSTTVDITECYRNSDYPPAINMQPIRAPYEPGQTSNHNFNNLEFVNGNVLGENSELIAAAKSSDNFLVGNGKDGSKDSLTHQLTKTITRTVTHSYDNSSQHSQESILQETEAFVTNLQILPITSKKKSTTNDAAIQTEPLETDPEDIALKIVQELEEWKAQQMAHFVQGLEQKELSYLAELDKKWEQQRAILQARLEAKIAECEKLNAKLEAVHAELKANALKHQDTINIVQTVKQDVERSYAEKFQQLDDEMQRLKHEIQRRAAESAEREIGQAQQEILQQQQEQVQLAEANLLESEEKLEMKLRIEQLEKQLACMEQTHIPAEQLQDMLADLHKQTKRFAEVEKAKEYYKIQWTKSARQLHKLQLHLLMEKEKALEEKKEEEKVEICLEEILEEEQVALNSDRKELKYIKNLLYDNDDTSESMESLDDFNAV